MRSSAPKRPVDKAGPELAPIVSRGLLGCGERIQREYPPLPYVLQLSVGRPAPPTDFQGGCPPPTGHLPFSFASSARSPDQLPQDLNSADIIIPGISRTSNGALALHNGCSRSLLTLMLPILPALQSIIDASPTGDLAFLVTRRHPAVAMGSAASPATNGPVRAGSPRRRTGVWRRSALGRLSPPLPIDQRGCLDRPRPPCETSCW